jgi:hypothetical protein
MVTDSTPQPFLFTFRPNGEAHGLRLTEVHVQLADYDVFAEEDPCARSWYGTEVSLEPMLTGLGVAPHIIEGVLAALGSHREADRNVSISSDRLTEAGFKEAA